MRDFYLTSTLRHPWNRDFNRRIAEALEGKGLRGYVPHRDTDQGGSQIFEQDIAGLLDSRVVLAVAENESPNWGAEVGLAYGRNIPVIALARVDHVLPLIAAGMVTRHVRVADLDDLDAYVDQLVAALRDR